MAEKYHATLRERILARRNHAVPRTPLQIAATGLLADDLVAEVEHLARLAKAGDVRARDVLYTSLTPRLHQIGYVVRPWPNTPHQTGIWDRDDVQQESWIIFTELLIAWEGELPFVTFLLSRFPWRLRDRILRGIGKPLPRLGTVRVPEDILAEVLAASDSDQPESALMARKLLEHVLNRSLNGEQSSAELRAILTQLSSPVTDADRKRLSLLDDDEPFSQIEAA